MQRSESPIPAQAQQWSDQHLRETLVSQIKTLDERYAKQQVKMETLEATIVAALVVRIVLA